MKKVIAILAFVIASQNVFAQQAQPIEDSNLYSLGINSEIQIVRSINFPANIVPAFIGSILTNNDRRSVVCSFAQRVSNGEDSRSAYDRQLPAGTIFKVSQIQRTRDPQNGNSSTRTSYVEVTLQNTGFRIGCIVNNPSSYSDVTIAEMVQVFNGYIAVRRAPPVVIR